jgi:ATP phosphoribosyltransferase
MTIPNSSPPENLKLAIPKKGRLHEKVVEVLKGAGIEFRRQPRLDVALCIGMPITLIFLSASDIAKFVGEGNVDLGITGQDMVQENGVVVEKVMDLGFGKCKLCVQAPVVDKIKDVETLAGKRIVTSFPNLTQSFFKEYDDKLGVSTSINYVSGSVEAACGLGLADAVVDLVETGTTMRAAGLEVVHDIISTEATLISNPSSEHKELIMKIQKRVEGYILATKYVMIMYNIPNELMDAAIKITPGKKSPTITNLACGNNKAVSSLVRKKEVSDKMDALQEAGATDILVLELKNSRM